LLFALPPLPLPPYNRDAATAARENRMKIEVEGRELVIRLDLEGPPYKASGSGKRLIAATTHGDLLTEVKVAGKPVTVSAVAYFPTT
jgi:hypothetical protein